MADAKHTPGPWTADWSKYRYDIFVVKAGMPSNRVLAQFDGDGDGPDDQSLADAHLISAAPDLLEALRQMVANAEADGKEYRDCYKKAVAAIDKAEGRS